MYSCSEVDDGLSKYCPKCVINELVSPEKHGCVIKEPILLKSQNSCLVPTGIAVAFSKEFEIQIRPRSGLAAKNNISVLNTPGTIDSDYRGEIKVILYNHGKKDFLINNKDRIAQMILTPVIKINFEEADELPETIRGEGGFGSTGK